MHPVGTFVNGMQSCESRANKTEHWANQDTSSVMTRRYDENLGGGRSRLYICFHLWEIRQVYFWYSPSILTPGSILSEAIAIGENGHCSPQPEDCVRNDGL